MNAVKTKVELGRRAFLELTALASGGLAVDVITPEVEAQIRPATAAGVPSTAAARQASARGVPLGNRGALLLPGANPVNPKPWLPPVEGGIELSPWFVTHPDNYVTMRINQNEEGQGVLTSNCMMFAEELECDWAKVRAMYIDLNRQARDEVYNMPRSGDMPRMTGTGTGASSSVRNGRWLFQRAGAQLRERLRFAAAVEWGCQSTR